MTTALMKFRCPVCSRGLRVPEQIIGRKVACPSCRNVLLCSSEGLEPATEKAVAARPRGRVDQVPLKLTLIQRAKRWIAKAVLYTSLIAVGVPVFIIGAVTATKWALTPVPPVPQFADALLPANTAIAAPVARVPVSNLQPVRPAAVAPAHAAPAEPTHSHAAHASVPGHEDESWVEGYTRKDGVHVKGHWRKKPHHK